MSNIVDVSVWNAASTHISFVAQQGSAGDKTPARWTIPAAVPNIALTTAQMSSQWNGNRTARHVNLDFVVPYVITNTTTGVISPQSRAECHIKFVLPTNVPQSVIDDMVAYACTFVGGSSAPINNAGVRSQIATGYAYS